MYSFDKYIAFTRGITRKQLLEHARKYKRLLYTIQNGYFRVSLQ